MTQDVVDTLLRMVRGRRPRPKVYVTFADGDRRRALGLTRDWVKVYLANKKIGLPWEEVIGVDVSIRMEGA
jgi:hypothetical protein